jgi:tetratricopeptide (TPR) repeat protein
MKSRPIALLLAALTASCTHTRLVRNAAPTATAAATVWDRQVRNAVDAGDGDVTLRKLREKIAAEPENVSARLELAQAYRDRGYREIALEISRLAVARFPESGPAQLSLIRDLRAVNRRAEAIPSLENFLKAHPQTTAEYYSWLGILRDESGLWPLGESSHRKAIDLAASVDYFHNNLGYNLLMQKKSEEAAAEFREALRLNPSSDLARNNLGLALANSNASNQAVAYWQSTSDPASAHNNLAVVWIEKGNYSEARKELELALSLNKNHAAALRNLDLVSRLDGAPPAIALSPEQETRWTRWKASVKRLFVGPLDEPRKDVAKTASAH